MNTHAKHLRGHACHGAALILLAFAGLSSAARADDASPPDARAFETALPRTPMEAPAAGATLLAESWWQRVMTPVWTGLANRRAMMQFGAIGMVLALVVIWWRRT